MDNKYIEYLYANLMTSRSNILIKDINPLNVDLKEYVIGFRFYELVNNKKKYISNWYYIGKKISLDEFEEDFNYALLVNHMKLNKVKYVCITRYDNFILVRDNDIVLNEYIDNKIKKRKY